MNGDNAVGSPPRNLLLFTDCISSAAIRFANIVSINGRNWFSDTTGLIYRTDFLAGVGVCVYISSVCPANNRPK